MTIEDFSLPDDEEFGQVKPLPSTDSKRHFLKVSFKRCLLFSVNRLYACHKVGLLSGLKDIGSAVDLHILIPVFSLLVEHKHDVVIAEQSEVI